MGINGEGIGFYKKTLVFVPGALKGEEIFCQITAVKHRFVQARLLTIDKKSKFRVSPKCPIYHKCGGCQIMHLRYDKQLIFKDDLIVQSLKKFKPEGYEHYDIRHTIGMKVPYHYRAKLQFQTRMARKKVIAGLFKDNSHYLVGIDCCLVQDELTQAIINRAVELLRSHHIPIYDERQQGGIRTIMVRKAVATKQVQLIFVMSQKVPLSHVIEELTADFNEIKGVAININTSKSSEIYGEKTKIIWGSSDISEKVLDYQFSLSPRAFYQLNPQQTEILYAQIVEALEVSENDCIIDAYCGVGIIGFAFASKVKSVWGVDIIEEAISDAKKNAERLGFYNTHYEVGHAENVISRWYQEGLHADALIVDPPRTGLDDRLLATILQYQPAKMVYVSCNPSTLARDLVTLSSVYDVHYIQSVDMFPQTARVECVVKLQRKEC